MQKKTDGFNDISMDQAMKFAKSDTGRQLLELLQRTQSDRLQSAMDQAAAGDYEQVKRTMNELLSSEQAQELVKKLKE